MYSVRTWKNVDGNGDVERMAQSGKRLAKIK